MTRPRLWFNALVADWLSRRRVTRRGWLRGKSMHGTRLGRMTRSFFQSAPCLLISFPASSAHDWPFTVPQFNPATYLLDFYPFCSFASLNRQALVCSSLRPSSFHFSVSTSLSLSLCFCHITIDFSLSSLLVRFFFFVCVHGPLRLSLTSPTPITLAPPILFFCPLHLRSSSLSSHLLILSWQRVGVLGGMERVVVGG